MFLNESKRVQASLMMATASAILLVGYEVIRSVSNSLFKQAYGVENLPLVMAFIPVFLVPVLYLYNRSLSRFGSKWTFALTSLGSSLTIFACYLLAKSGVKFASFIIYLVRESYVILIIEQIWSFANSTLTQSEAKRFNGVMLSISSVGAITGGMAVHLLAPLFGTANLLVIAALMCLPSGALGMLAYRHYPHVRKSAEGDGRESEAKGLGLNLFREQKVLIMILTMIIASQAYSTIVALNFQVALQDTYPNIDEQTSFSGLFFAVLHLVSLSFQLIASPLLLGSFSIASLHVAIPLVHFCCAACALLKPGLWTSGLALMAFKSIDYSVFRAAKEILYIPLSFDARFRAKKLIDVLGYRFSKSATSIMITASQRLGVSWSSFALAGISAFSALLWLAFVVPILKSKSARNVNLKLPKKLA